MKYTGLFYSIVFGAISIIFVIYCIKKYKNYKKEDKYNAKNIEENKHANDAKNIKENKITSTARATSHTESNVPWTVFNTFGIFDTEY